MLVLFLCLIGMLSEVMVTIGMVSLATCKTDDDPKGLVLTSEMFKTDKVFNICAYVICILLAVIYTACW